MTAGSIPVSRATSTRKVCISDRALFQASPVITRISSVSSASVGSVGDSFDNALAETINGLYKTELIKHRGPWRTVEQVEYGTAEWVDWLNHRRLYEYCGDIPPAELENAYYRQTQPAQPVGNANTAA
jgi:transposase InsO family protein